MEHGREDPGLGPREPLLPIQVPGRAGDEDGPR